MENDELPDLSFLPGQRMPMKFFEFQHPARPATAFSFSADPRQTNALTYYAPTGAGNMPFKILRSASANKPVLMLLHGMGLHPASFRGIAGHLLNVCDLILVDYTGFTSRDASLGGVSMRVLAHAIMAIPKALALQSIHIGGSSLGGGLSLMAAVDFPAQVKKIVLFNPAIFPQPLPGFYRLVRIPLLGPLIMQFISPQQLVCGVTTIGYVDPAKVDGELINSYHDNMKPAVNRHRLRDLIRHLPVRDAEVRRYLEQAGKLPQQVLVIWGEQDQLLAAGTGERLRQALPHNEFHSFPDLSHLPHEESPDRIGPIAAEFIARQPA
jgi:pimeloyl-ACP methyl ester carboxylesterase